MTEAHIYPNYCLRAYGDKSAVCWTSLRTAHRVILCGKIRVVVVTRTSTMPRPIVSAGQNPILLLKLTFKRVVDIRLKLRFGKALILEPVRSSETTECLPWWPMARIPRYATQISPGQPNKQVVRQKPGEFPSATAERHGAESSSSPFWQGTWR